MKIVIVSPHTDDAIFSLGDSIEKMVREGDSVTILSPFAGIPADDDGFRKHKILRMEHAKACQIIGAEFVNGDFLDDVYPERDLSRLSKWLTKQVEGFDRIFVPLGIHHPDHIIVRNICLQFFDDFAYYEELPYRILYPELRDSLATKLIGDRTLKYTVNVTNKKRKAIETYISQIIGHKILEQLYVSERIWV